LEILEKLKISGPVMMTQEEEVPHRDVRFQTQTKAKGAGAGGANTLCSPLFR
jgi:hypothetical protein